MYGAAKLRQSLGLINVHPSNGLLKLRRTRTGVPVAKGTRTGVPVAKGTDNRTFIFKRNYAIQLNRTPDKSFCYQKQKSIF
jgi:hypothetical protein